MNDINIIKLGLSVPCVGHLVESDPFNTAPIQAVILRPESPAAGAICIIRDTPDNQGASVTNCMEQILRVVAARLADYMMPPDKVSWLQIDRLGAVDVVTPEFAHATWGGTKVHWSPFLDQSQKKLVEFVKLKCSPAVCEWVSQWLGLGEGEEVNPFVKHRDTLLFADHGGARRLQALALNLYNGAEWPVDMGSLASYLDREYWDRALEMLEWYRKYGENDPEFMTVCRHMADERLAAREESA